MPTAKQNFDLFRMLKNRSEALERHLVIARRNVDALRSDLHKFVDLDERLTAEQVAILTDLSFSLGELELATRQLEHLPKPPQPPQETE